MMQGSRFPKKTFKSVAGVSPKWKTTDIET